MNNFGFNYSMIEEYKDDEKDFSINCVDPLNRSALISAIENENFELIQLLLEAGISVGVNIICNIELAGNV